MVSGKEIGEGHKDVRTNSDGLVDIAYTDARAPDMVWRLGVAYAQRVVPMLQGLCAGKPSRCRKQKTMPFSIESQEEEEEK